MAYANSEEATKVLQVALGVSSDGKYDGVFVGWIRAHEVVKSVASWRRGKGTGTFYVTLPSIFQDRGSRSKVFRTVKSRNNEFNIEQIRDYIKELAAVRKRENERREAEMSNMTANAEIVERVKAAYTGKRYITDYESAYSASIVPSKTFDGRVNISWPLTLSEKQAIKFVQFINSLEESE